GETTPESVRVAEAREEGEEVMEERLADITEAVKSLVVRGAEEQDPDVLRKLLGAVGATAINALADLDGCRRDSEKAFTRGKESIIAAKANQERPDGLPEIGVNL